LNVRRRLVQTSNKEKNYSIFRQTENLQIVKGARLRLWGLVGWWNNSNFELFEFEFPMEDLGSGANLQQLLRQTTV
jgi:hypothetical protein